MSSTDPWGGWVTPDLARNPGLASDAINSKQPQNTGSVLSMASKGITAQDAINDHANTNGTQSFWAQAAGKTVSGLEWLGKPLTEIQKDYKFVHSIYQDHGFLPGFAATVGVLGGAVLGGLAGGAVGVALGADITALGLRKIMGSTYTDSYAKSEDPNYKVSAGRDFSNAISKATSAVGLEAVSKAFKNTNAGIGKIFSGTNDLIFDINADPLQVVGRFGWLMKNGKYLKNTGEIELKYPIMNTIPGVKNFIAARTGMAVNSEQMDLLRAGSGVKVKGVDILNGPSRVYNRAIEDIADVVKKAREAGTPQLAAGDLIQKYPQFGTENVGRIVAEKLDTADKVHNYFKTSMYLGEVENNLAGQAMLPARTLLRATLSDSTVANYLRQASQPKFIVDQATGNTIANPEYNAKSAGRFLGKVYQTFSGYMPYSVDPEAQKLSLNKFKWNSPDAATTVYRIGRMGLGDRAAKIFAGKYAEAVATNDVATARSIKNQALWETLKGLGLPDDNKFVKEAWDAVSKVDQPLASTQIYGTDVLGNPLGQYATTRGLKTGGLTKTDAADTFDIPNFIAIKNELRNYGVLKENFNKLDQEVGNKLSRVLYGHNDEFIVDRYINKIFKPLALATTGFGLRVAAAELIPTFARYGIINTFKAKLATSAAKANVDLMPKEVKGVLGATMMALGAHLGINPDFVVAGYPAFAEAKRRGLTFASKLLPDEQMELATKLVLANNGHLLSDTVSTGHGYDASTAYQSNQAADYYYQINRRNLMFKEQKDYTTYTPTEKHYPVMLSNNLNKAAKDTTFSNIATDLVAEVKANENRLLKNGVLQKPAPGIIGPEFHSTQEFQDLRQTLINKEYSRMLDAARGIYKGYDEEINTITRWHDAISDGTLHNFAADRVDALLGKVIGRDGTYHPQFAEGVANKGQFSVQEIYDMTKTQSNSLPAGVAGPILDPYVPGDLFKLNYITNLGFKKVIDPIVNGLSREPLYLLHVGDAYSQLKPMIDKGWITDDQALRIAQTRGSYSMLPQIHNTALRNQFAQLARNFLPFYFAQEQALRRTFKTLKDTSVGSPLISRGMRFYQLAEHAINDPGFIQADENGNRYYYFPGAGAFGQAFQSALASYGVPIVTGLPVNARGSMVSLKSVLPEMQTPGVAPFLAVSGNILADWFPTLKPVVEGTIGKISLDRSVMDTVIPATWAKALLAQNSSTDFTNQMSNALAGALSAAYYHKQVPGPDSSALEQQAFIDRIKNNARSILLMKTVMGLTSPLAPQVSQEDLGFRDEFWKLVKQKGNFSDALMTFLGEHGNSAVSYTVAKTEAAFPGGKVPYIQPTVDFIKEHNDLFFPKDPTKSLASGAFFLIPQDNIKNESDRSVYNTLLSMHFRSQRTPEELLKQFYVAEGDAIISPLITQHAQVLNNAFDPFTKQQENDRWSGIMTKMKNLYPIWYSDYSSADRRTNATVAYNQIQKILQSPDAPTNDQTKMVRSLVSDYQSHQNVMSQYKMMNIQGFLPTAEKQKWENYLTQLSVNNPRLNSVIKSVFLKLG